MNKQEFIDRLRNALNGRVAPNLVQENINYYEDYINTQVRMGRSEQEVLENLGDPRLIAKTIVETSGQGRTDNYGEGVYQGHEYRNVGQRGGSYQNSNERKWNKTFRIPGWLWIVIVILVLVFIFAIVSSVLSFLAPIILPILVVVFLVKLFRDWLN